MALVIKNATIVTLNHKREIINADIFCEGDRIKEIFPCGAPDIPGARVIQADGKIVIPGLVNAHTHNFQTVYRGLGDGLEFGYWQREVTYPLYEQMTAEDAYVFTLLGCIENIRSGVTTAFNFQAYPNDLEACTYTAKAFVETGIRGILVKSFFGQNAPKQFFCEPDKVLADCRSVLNLSGSAGGRVKFWLGPPMPAQASAEIIKAVYAIAHEHGVGLHVHTAESAALVKRDRAILGKGEIEFMFDLGVLDEKFHAVHCVALSERELNLIKDTGAHVIHCPVSNMYLGSGIAPVPEMMSMGINVALGTDGPASNNNQDMIATMKAASLLQKVRSLDPAVMPSGTVLEMATLNGARAAGLETEIGSIEVGKKADIVILDFKTSHTIPTHKPVSTLIYAATYGDVETVIVDGRLVMENRKVLVVDEQNILDRAQRLADELLTRAGKEHLKVPKWPIA